MKNHAVGELALGRQCHANSPDVGLATLHQSRYHIDQELSILTINQQGDCTVGTRCYRLNKGIDMVDGDAIDLDYLIASFETGARSRTALIDRSKA